MCNIPNTKYLDWLRDKGWSDPGRMMDIVSSRNGNYEILKTQIKCYDYENDTFRIGDNSYQIDRTDIITRKQNIHTVMGQKKIIKILKNTSSDTDLFVKTAITEILIQLILCTCDETYNYVPYIYDIAMNPNGQDIAIIMDRFDMTLDEFIRLHFTTYQFDLIFLKILSKLSLIIGLIQANFNFIHRDLKTDNIMLEYSDDRSKIKLKIIDFGLSALTTADCQIVNPNKIMPNKINYSDSVNRSNDLSFFSLYCLNFYNVDMIFHTPRTYSVLINIIGSHCSVNKYLYNHLFGQKKYKSKSLFYDSYAICSREYIPGAAPGRVLDNVMHILNQTSDPRSTQLSDHGEANMQDPNLLLNQKIYDEHFKKTTSKYCIIKIF